MERRRGNALSRGPLVAVAWCDFQPRTVALARALDGQAVFLRRSGLHRSPLLLPLRYLIDGVRMWRRLNCLHPAVVYAISPPVFAPMVAFTWCALHRRTLLIDCHTDAFRSRKWGWSRPLHRWLSRRAVAVTCHTEGMAREVREWGATGVLLPDDVPNVDQARGRTPASAPRVVVAGALDSQEPIAVVIEGARLVPEIEVRFTGDEQRVPNVLRASAPPNVVFTGWLDYPEFLGELLSAHVVAAFSTDPGIMNRAAFEAIGLGKALVLTDFPGLRERFGDAALYCNNDPAAMAAALRRAVQERVAMERASAAAQATLRAQWDQGLSEVKRLLQGARQQPGGSRRRVLMVSQHPYPFASVLRRNVDHLLAKGFDVDLVCTADGPPMAAVPHAALEVHRISVKHRRRPTFWYAVEYIVFFLLAVPLVSWLGIRRRYDVVQVDNVPDFLVFSALVPRLRGARIVLHMWELMPEMTSARLNVPSHHPLVRVARWVERRATSWVDHIIAVNDACRRVLSGRGVPSEKVSIIYNTQPGVQLGALAERHAGPLLITHGTLVERYGVQIAIRALPLLRRNWPDLMLQVVGGGEYQAVLAALAVELGVERHVTFLPWLSFADILAQIRRATIGIVPVIADRYGHVILPTKLFDYITEGVPAVCSRLPAVQERFPADAIAYFTPGNAEELAQEIDRLLHDPRAAAHQAERAREALRAIDWEAMSGQYLIALGAT